jgi:hypothetical protein
MKNSGSVKKTMHRWALTLGAGMAALVLSSGAFAQHGGGGGGHGGGGGGGHAAGGGAHFSGGGHYGGGGYHGGYGGYHGGYGGWHGGYGGWHGGYYGWRGGWGGCWGCWWGPTLGLGLYFSTLPLYYSTYWWDGVPYYYADNNYYVYDPNAGQYQTVAPPEGLASQVQPGVQQGGAAPSGDLAVYPKNGQSADQTSKDKFECHQWAASQSGYDPTQGTSANPSKRSDYMRAEAACLTGRGYSVM